MKTFQLILSGIFTSVFLFLNASHSEACTFSASFSGSTMVCAGNSVTYQTTSTSGHHYRWVVTGGTVVSGAGTYSLVVNWPTPGNWSVALYDSTSTCKDSTIKKIKVGLNSAVLTAAPLNAAGSASVSGRTATITTASGNENGAAWNPYSIDLNKNFDFTFTTNQNGAADGMMFIIQNTSSTTYNSAGQGSDMGYYNASSGNMDESIGIEQDIYKSSTAYDDSSASHLNLVIDKSPTPIRPQVNISPALGGGSNHTVRILWNRDINLFQYYFDTKLEYSWPNDIVKNVFNGNPNVWFGFTGATGGSTATQTATVDTLIYNQAIINISSDTICSGDSATLTASSGLSYSWSNGAKTKAIKIAKSGTYSVTITDSFGCTSSASITATIVTMPKVSASFTVGTACLGNNLYIANNSTPSTGVRYEWNFGDGDSSSGNPPTYAYKSTGKYTLNMTATNGGCTSRASQAVTVYTHPAGMVMSKSVPFQGQFNRGDLFNPDEICVGDTNVYQISPPAGYTNSDFGKKWIISNLTFATAGGTVNTDTFAAPPGSTKNAYFKFYPSKGFADSILILNVDIQLIPGGCDTLITRYIEVRPKAVSRFGFSNACNGYPVNFKDSSTINTGDVISYWAWNFGDSTTSTLENPRHTYARPGTYKVTMTATSSAGCGIPITKTVTEYPSPVTKYGIVLGCQKAVSTFTDSSSISSGSIVSRAWSFGDGISSTLKNPTHNYAKSGPYKVKLVVTSSYGCKDSLIEQVRVEPQPVAAFGYKDACVGTPIYLTNKSTDSATGTTYHWDFGDGTTSTASSPAKTYTANGSFATTLVVTSRFGCKDTIKQTITPYAEPAVHFVYTGACTKNAVAFGDSDKNGAGATYTWSFGDGGSDVTNSDTSTHIYTKAGANKVMLTIQSANGCKDTASKIVNISDYPIASFTAPNVCAGKTTSFTNTTSGTGITYIWNFGDTSSGKLNISTSTNPTHTYSSAGTYTVKLAATNSGGCTDTLIQLVNVVALPTVGKWFYRVHNYGVTFTPQDTTQKTYKWYFGTGDSSSLKKPQYTYKTKGKYYVKLQVTNATGCTAFYGDSITITGLGIETATGNNNDLNMTIFPNPSEGKTKISYSLSTISKVNISVYDLRGKLIAELKNGNFGAGDYQDEFDAAKYHANEGVYMVKLVVNGIEYTGRIVELK